MITKKYNSLPQLQKDDVIALISHISPDGDSLGSLLALGMGLKKLCNNVKIYINDELPEKYNFLPGVQDIQLYNEKNKMIFDFCFVLDCGDQQRLGYSEEILSRSNKVINIDHHISNNGFGDINIIDLEASSTCEIVLDLLKDKDIPLDTNIATCLYTGIATDTGNFIYDNTTKKTHKAAAELMEHHIDLNNITYNLYQNKSLDAIKFLGYILNRLELSCDGKLAIMMVYEDDLRKYKLASNDVDGVINYARDIQGVEIAILLKETSNGSVRVGFRSKNNVDVSELAGKFGGGGHKKASGATMIGSMKEIRDKIEVQINNDLGWDR
ncbi:phosphoesterase RecJ domain-containing protein [Anaerovirgula multivorans]|uniref:Phosphoesterase RecJ domain-containing protein n=1 Tax=Anaerovirgula multivorans TaxID=312168 RepID=A0A239A1W2_9FIRM|nr:bifunctional oligoribonuclease/PAP phosphatase NrnA [Anaerovirgula multivorans]SNR88893.1 phosphoesterase RecJ domain-containing protein [Anaerovirgula multivorans]